MDTFGGIERLTERQKEILRLLSSGHDAKSAAVELGISVHTVNDHLSEARKHLGASNSRAAARLFADFEGALPKNEGPHRLGMSNPNDDRATFALSDAWKRWTLAGGLIVILFSVALIGFLFGKGGESSEAAMAAPNVVSTSPADGSTISPGPFDLTVRFDRPLLEGSYSFVQISPETFPDCRPGDKMSPDRRSYTMRCTAAAGRDYEVWFNRPPYMNFRSTNGVSAQPHRIRFKAR
ncbi:LuxR C-terminal-related transcriptional regulator [Altererythrobacter rubellus]|uniref:LuxR C-terminal-related transcriptional regulator n=1 Tax=Altererythrobacter rubellus TaxID=2173831 RepID=A0A9Y2B5T9_9SPHN|nr:LuxR C-terminal-related transcriptional regulator [Altererythrobacter rubellus]WIW94591.1 LuxR C-terminal-related transcriptional regulator [Altererythrobacter rubellus]